MNFLPEWHKAVLHFSILDFVPYLYAALTLLLGYFVAKAIGRFTARALSHKLTLQQLMLTKKILYYFVFIIFLISALQQLGFKLSVLLSAAGVLSVAISFAAQTSISNIISGLFLILEQPFVLGETIQVNNIEGVVESIDFLSVNLRTADNTMIRLANETLIKAQITNLSRYETRRFDLKFSVDYSSDLEKTKKICLKVAAENAFAIKDPEPNLQILAFSESAIDMQLSTWCKTPDLANLKYSLSSELKNSLEASRILMAVPKRTMHFSQENHDS